MRKMKFFWLMLAMLLVMPGAVRSAHAASFAYCLSIDGSLDRYYLNFNVQGSSILVSGALNHPPDDHGPLFGSVTLTPYVPALEMGLTVTYLNGGDYTGPSFQHIVFGFNSDGSISFKRSVQGTPGFTQGLAHPFTCPTV